MRIRRLVGAELDEYRIRSTDSIQSAMERMNETGHTLLLVASPDKPTVLEGVLADGDVRRFLVEGGRRDALVVDAVNSAPLVFESDVNIERLRREISRPGIVGVPLVDAGVLVGFAVEEPARPRSEMAAVIMAGGLGSRLAPLTDDCPKPLLPIGGKPILTHVIDELRFQGFRRLFVSLNYLGDRIVDHYQDGSHWDVDITYVHETERLGTGGALALIDPGELTEEFVVLNADLLHNINLNDVMDLHRTRGWSATMVVRPHTFRVEYGVVEVAADGAFERIREKPTEERLINAGVYVLNRSALSLIPRSQVFDLPNLFGALKAAGRTCGTFEYSGRWIDIGTMPEYERARSIFSDEGPDYE